MTMVDCTVDRRLIRDRTCGRLRHQDGAVAVMFVGGLLIILGFCGLALDLSQVFNRKMELQTVADTAALAAALELDGTAAGIDRASTRAAARFSASAPSALTFNYGNGSIDWSDSAVAFGTSPRGPWLSRDAAAGKASPNRLLYVKLDTAALAPLYGQVGTLFISAIASTLATVTTSARAVAGRVAIAVTPLGICTMRPEAKRNRSGELEEYGFRRGVAYDVMQLNPNATATAQTFLLNPLAAPGQASAPASDFNTVAPFVCTGTMGVARVMGGKMNVSTPFPLADYYQQFNSRFDTYVAPCTPDSAPPDINVKAYAFNGAVPWMSAAPSGQAAALSLADGKRWTISGPDPTPPGTVAAQYGPLWAYTKAARYADPAPAAGYATFATTDWKTLYDPGQPASAGYPSTTPYTAGGINGKTPTRKGMSGRRVLNLALLSCPVSGGKATVQGIGRFFMTVPADPTHLYAEFAGLTDEQTLRAQVKLFP